MTRNDLNSAHQDEIVEETTSKRRLIVKKEARRFLDYTVGFAAGALAATIVIKMNGTETDDV